MRKIILASASPRRREILENIGAEFEVCPAKGEEKITKTDPGEVVEELSLQKCREVFTNLQGDVTVIGADTVVALDGKIFGKPGNCEEAVEMLFKMIEGDYTSKKVKLPVYYIKGDTTIV